MSLFKKIPHIPTSEQLANIVFSKLKKIKVESPKGKKKRSELSFHKTLGFKQFRTIFPDLDERLRNIVESFPNIDLLHPFHQELIDALFSVDELRISLARIDNTRRALASIQRDLSRRLGKATDASIAAKIRREAVGRIGSTIKKLSKPLQALIEAKIALTKIPDFDLSKKTIAFAGAPNVGKSSFVKLISTGKPEVAAYPFTTKELFCGHRFHGFEVIQLVDTPGLLDRPLSERNAIEMRSIIALRHLADLIIYLFDPTPAVTLNLNQQMNLLIEIRQIFPETPILQYINKKDIVSKNRIIEVRKIVGDLELIATIEGNEEQLEEIFFKALEQIPEKKKYLPQEKLASEFKDKEQKEEQKEKDGIEWITLD